VHLIGCVSKEDVMERDVTERDVTTRHPVAEGHALVLEYKVGTTWVRLPSTNPLIRHLLHSLLTYD